MTKYLLDTSVIVFLLRGKYGVAEHLRKIQPSQCFVSDVTIAELTYGAYHSDRVEWNLKMINDLVHIFNVVPFSKGINEYGRQKSLLIKDGKMIEDFDLFIGCSAVAEGMVMVTDNTKHFSRIEGISLENWVER